MTLKAISDFDGIREAYALLATGLSEGGETRITSIGYKSNNEQVTVIWHSDVRMWVLLEPERLDNRYWCAFGLEEPRTNSLLPIACEINIPREGVNRRVAAAIAEEPNGTLTLVHSGKVAGGRKGIGKDAFLNYYDGGLVNVDWADGRRSACIPVTKLSASDMKRAIARFVRCIADFKTHITGR